LPLWDFGARLHPTTKNAALLVSHVANVCERHRALHCHARFDPPGVLFHLSGCVEHDSFRGNGEGAVGRLLRVTFDAAAVHHRAGFRVANGPVPPRSLPGGETGEHHPHPLRNRHHPPMPNGTPPMPVPTPTPPPPPP